MMPVSSADLDAFRSALRSLAGQIVGVDERRSSFFSTVINALARGRTVRFAELAALAPHAERGLTDGRTSGVRPRVGITVIGMRGVALYDLEFQPYAFSTARLAQKITDAAADPASDAIVLDINTPGGAVTGTAEAADAVYNATKKKPVIGIINPLCASAGYWIASQCTKLLAVPSADVGSIGVFMCHLDFSAALADAGIKPTFIKAGEFKTEGNALEPLSGEAKAFYQSEVDQTYDDFLKAVARGRGVSRHRAKLTYGQGRVLRADAALNVGMIDAVEASPGLAMSAAIGFATKQKADYRARRLNLEAKS